MEETNATDIIIDIKLDDEGVAKRLAQVNEGVAALQETSRELRKEIKKGNDEDGQKSKILAEVDARIKTLKAEQSALNGQVANATAGNRVYGDSLKELSAKLNDMRDRYKSLSEAEREGAVGKSLQKDIQDLDAKLKSADGSIGLFQRNVGDYANQVAKISGLFGSAGGAATSLTGQLGLVTNGMGALAATPLIGILTLLVTVVQKVIQAMKGSEEQTMRWREIMATFEPLVVAMKNGLTAFANVLVTVVGKAIDGVTTALHGLAKAADWVGGIFGADWGLSQKTEQMKAQAQAQRELTRAENDYIISKRAWGVEAAKIDRDVADLRAKAVDKENYTNQQRLDFLRQALGLEEEKARRERDLAQQNLDNLKARAEQTENDAEMNEKLAAAEIEVVNADTRLSETQRSMTREMNRLHSEIRQDGVAAWNAYVEKLKEARKEMGSLIEKLPSVDESIKEAAKRSREMANRMKEVIDRVGLLNETFDKLPSAEELFGDLAEVTDENLTDTTTRWELFAESFAENSKSIEKTAASLSSSFGSMSSIYKEMAKDETKTEAERARAAQKAKTWAGLQIAANSGTALAKGIAGAMDAPTVAGKIAALASIMAAVLSAVAQAKALAMQTFETGGVIGGYKGASMGRDNTAVVARNGEMIINAAQQRQLFEIANGGANGSVADAIAQALRNMPSPVLDYKEFTDFQQRVVTLTENQLLR